ncbi:hypothetical protein HU200_014919 [Digitaria exilis]|uniref:F-box domain-containing protein n=1 Tax=Digitaria exilis TaxID=1010633 RepID=A0A835KL30_9POAL|nr:hypothetical protein HU200_014919 [Digitaria exilis]
MGEDGRRRSCEDLISGLPDELLHGILVRLRCARAAARTSVLSRRWRRVWTHLPELHLDDPASSPDTVDGALAGYLAPDLWRLSISPAADLDYRVLAWRAAPWLRFAAERVVGELRLRYVSSRPRRLNPEADLELPACGRAQAITLFLGVEWRLRPRPGGLFSALAALTIRESLMIDGTDLSSLNEVEINCHEDFHEGLEFVELLFRCNAKVQKLVINYKVSGTPKTEVCEKVRNMCRPNVKVKFYVFPDGPHGRRVLFDRVERFDPSPAPDGYGATTPMADAAISHPSRLRCLPAPDSRRLWKASLRTSSP